MWAIAPLVIRLAAVSLVAMAVANSGTVSDSSVLAQPSTSPKSPIRITIPMKKPSRRQRNRRRTTTTTTTTPAYDDDDDLTTRATTTTTTIDPRSFDHTDLGSCQVPLGMESGKILNESLSATSSYDTSVSPLSSRIRTEIRGGAWCPNGLISPRSVEYLEINLHDEYLITATETQGRFANSVGVEFVQSYSVEYWRVTLNRWTKYKDFNGSRLLKGNVNTYTPCKTTLEAPFIASKVRFYPYAAHPRTVCMRVELYGCRWKQSVIAYSAPEGGDMQSMTGGARFEDLSYDGIIRNGKMINGLGQITDSLIGPNDFEIADPLDTDGTRWVGWNKSMLLDDELILTFNFSNARIFLFVNIHTNNMFTKDVQLFKEAQIYCSLDGERWQQDYLSHEPKQDKVSEHARTVHIDLENRTAKHIMIKLKFQHEWILISEITFKSVATVLNTSAAYLEDYYRTDAHPTSRIKRNSTVQISVGFACGAVVGAGVIIAAAAVLISKRTRRRIPNIFKKLFCPTIRGPNTRNNRRSPRIASALANCPAIHMLRSPPIVDEDYREPYNIWRDTLGRRDKCEIHDQNEYNEIYEDADFPRPYMMKRPEPLESFYAATDIIHRSYPDQRSFRHECPAPGLFTSIKLPEAEPPNGVAPLLDFPRGRMRQIEFLGEGPHGTLQICETDGIDELSDEELTSCHRRRRLVVVKTLWRGCHNDIKAAFCREATWGAGLKHPQLAQVLGLSLLEPPCAALDRGDAVPLPTILKMERKLNYSSLIHIGCQIASGMKYLESFELVHRDLAARNITVSENLHCKVADYAMFCEEFVDDYHVRTDGSRIPLRWMSWESVLMDVYSPASDVWSFGVTIWETVTYCSAQPFEEMNDDQVIANATVWRSGGRGARVPAAPLPRCRRELYDLMHECWRREPMHRPRFHDLHKFLDRMTHGLKLQLEP